MRLVGSGQHAAHIFRYKLSKSPERELLRDFSNVPHRGEGAERRPSIWHSAPKARMRWCSRESSRILHISPSEIHQIHSYKCLSRKRRRRRSRSTSLVPPNDHFPHSHLQPSVDSFTSAKKSDQAGTQPPPFSVLAIVAAVQRYMLPVSFSHIANANKKNT